MIEKIAKKWAYKIVSDAGDSTDLDIIQYGIECTLNQVLINVIQIVVGFLIGYPIEMLLYMILFKTLRMNIGGVHGLSHLVCFALSVSIAVLCCSLSHFLERIPFLLIMECVFGLIVVIFCSPVTHPNKPVSENRLKKFKKISLLIIILEMLFVGISYFFFATIPWIAHIGALSITAASFSCLIGKLAYGKNRIKVQGSH